MPKDRFKSILKHKQIQIQIQKQIQDIGPTQENTEKPKPANKVTTRWEGPQSLSYHKQ